MNLDAITFVADGATKEIGDALREAGEYLARCEGYLAGVQYQDGGDRYPSITLFISNHVAPADDYTYADALRKQVEDRQVRCWAGDRTLMRLQMLMQQEGELDKYKALYQEYAGHSLDEGPWQEE